MKKTWIILCSALLLLTMQPVVVLAQEQEYSVTGSVTVIGGTLRSSGDFTLEDVIGATAVGGLESLDFHVDSGDPVHSPLNNPPIADAGGPYLTAVGTTIALSGSASYDPDGDPLTYYAWTQHPSGGTLTYDQEYSHPIFTAGSAAGIVELKMAVDDGILQDSATTMVVVYDPTGGFVTGGGWIWSPAGAYVSDPNLTGKATFGLVSKYLKGANVPTGQTEFQFKVANLNFKSSSYDWLVVAGARAQYKGTGTINGAGSYRFMLTAIDADLLGSGKNGDTFRIRIWSDGGGLVYDNQLNAPDTADPTIVVYGGSIIIHK